MLFLYVIFVFKVYFFSHIPEINHINHFFFLFRHVIKISSCILEFIPGITIIIIDLITLFKQFSVQGVEFIQFCQ